MIAVNGDEIFIFHDIHRKEFSRKPKERKNYVDDLMMFYAKENASFYSFQSVLMCQK